MIVSNAMSEGNEMAVDMLKMSRGTVRSWRSSACLLAALALGLGAREASAKDGNAADTAAARTLAVEGMKLAEAGKCAEAIEKLTRAERLHHAPIILSKL